MRRKVIKQGHNTLTVSLPRKWCINHSLKEGEEIDVNEKGNNLILSKEAFRGLKEITVDVTGLDRSTIILLIQSLYTYGYEMITITTKDATAKWYWGKEEPTIPSVINYAVSRLIGAEIISSSKGRYKIQIVTAEDKEKFDTILRRVFLLVIELFDNYIERYRKLDIKLIESVELTYLNLRKFLNYAERLLNKFGHEEADKTSYYFAILLYLGRISETVKNLSGPPFKPLKPTKKCCDMIAEIREAFKDYYKVFYKYDISQISNLHRTRDIFKGKFLEKHKDLSKDDIYLLGGLTQIFEVMVDLNEMKMAIGY